MENCRIHEEREGAPRKPGTVQVSRGFRAYMPGAEIYLWTGSAMES